MLNSFVNHLLMLVLVSKFSSAVIGTNPLHSRTKLSLNPRIVGTKGFDSLPYAFAF
jgi:hypothetical protein